MGWPRPLASGKYQGKYRGPDGIVRTAPGGPFTHKAAALRAANATEAESRAPGWRDPSAGLMTWGAWCAEWWKTRNVEASTMGSDVGRRDNHLLPRWAAVALVDITRHDVKVWTAELAQSGLSPSTVVKIAGMLAASLEGAVDAEILRSNPAAKLKLPHPQTGAERYLERDEFEVIAVHLKGPWLQMALLLVGTGMRFGEAAGLHMSSVSPGWVRVADVWDRAAGSIRAYPKSKRQRDVPLPDWVDLGKGNEGACGTEHRGCHSRLAVPSTAGTPLDIDNFRKRWDSACKAAGVGLVRPHDLRHTYASWLLQNGVSLAEVGRLLGHISPATTARYAHLSKTPADTVLKALGRPDRVDNTSRPSGPEGNVTLRGSHLRIVR